VNKLITNRWLHFAFLLIVLISMVYGFSADKEFRKRIRFATFDIYQELKPRDYKGDVVIVDFDDESLTRVGQWPWPRVRLAEIISNLTLLGAKSIAFDGVLAEPDRNSPTNIIGTLDQDYKDQILKTIGDELPDYDSILAGSIRESGIFITSYSHGSNKASIPLKRGFKAKRNVREALLNSAQKIHDTAQFLPILQKEAAGTGSFMAEPDEDGLIRRTGMVFSDTGDLYPSLSLEAIRVAEDKKGFYKVFVPDQNKSDVDSAFHIVVGGYEAPLDEQGKIYVYYKKHNPEEDYVSAYKLLGEEFLEEIKPQVKDKIVFLGSSAEGLKDLRATPLNRFLPGVEIHANVAEQILNNQFLFRPAQANQLEDSLILVFGLGIILLAPFLGAVFLAFICFSVIGLSFYSSWQLFVDQGALFDPVYFSVAIFIIFSLSTILTYIRSESERKQIKGAFGHYISPDFMKELTKDPDKLKLGGENKDLTVMFTDIRSFTTICEGLSPEEIIQLMNDFLTPMSDLVMSNRGTIDKYMGDAMMAFWNAPLDDPDHARHACLAALGMQEALEPINEGVREKARDIGKEPVLLQAGIGINTGPCAVGNMGSRQRFAYSTLGDAVNLASRLEGQTKTYGVGILIGEETYKQVKDFAVLEIDLIQVKGKTKPEYVYILLGDSDMGTTSEFMALREKNEAMINAYRGGDFKAAQGLAKECLTMQAYGLEKAYELYISRTDELIKNPPKEWDGVFVAQTK